MKALTRDELIKTNMMFNRQSSEVGSYNQCDTVEKQIRHYVKTLSINHFFQNGYQVRFLHKMSHDPPALLMQPDCEEIPLESSMAKLSLLTKFNI